MQDTQQFLIRLDASENGLSELLFSISEIALSPEPLTIESYHAIKPALQALQKRLLDHFEPQNDAFFNVLKISVEEDAHASKMVEFLSANMRDIKIKTLTFFDLHPADMSDVKPKSFQSDFIDFLKELKEFIRLEREQLPPLLKKVKI